MRTNLNPPDGVYVHWTEEAFYYVVTMLETIKYLPNRFNPLTSKNVSMCSTIALFISQKKKKAPC